MMMNMRQILLLLGLCVFFFASGIDGRLGRRGDGYLKPVPADEEMEYAMKEDEYDGGVLKPVPAGEERTETCNATCTTNAKGIDGQPMQGNCRIDGEDGEEAVDKGNCVGEYCSCYVSFPTENRAEEEFIENFYEE